MQCFLCGITKVSGFNQEVSRNHYKQIGANISKVSQ